MVGVEEKNVGKSAGLPRVVTVHDVSIIPEKKGAKDASSTGLMLMKATVKTYNEGSRDAAPDPKKGKGKDKKKDKDKEKK